MPPTRTLVLGATLDGRDVLVEARYSRKCFDAITQQRITSTRYEREPKFSFFGWASLAAATAGLSALFLAPVEDRDAEAEWNPTTGTFDRPTSPVSTEAAYIGFGIAGAVLLAGIIDQLGAINTSDLQEDVVRSREARSCKPTPAARVELALGSRRATTDSRGRVTFSLATVATLQHEAPTEVTTTRGVSVALPEGAVKTFVDERARVLCRALGLVANPTLQPFTRPNKGPLGVFIEGPEEGATEHDVPRQVNATCHDEQWLVVQSASYAYVAKRSAFQSAAEVELEYQTNVLQQAQESKERGEAGRSLELLASIRAPREEVREEVRRLTQELKHEVVANAIAEAEAALARDEPSGVFGALGDVEPADRTQARTVERLLRKARRRSAAIEAGLKAAERRRQQRLLRSIERLSRRNKATVNTLVDLYHQNVIISASLYGQPSNHPRVVTLNEVRRRLRRAQPAACLGETKAAAVAVGIARFHMRVVVALRSAQAKAVAAHKVRDELRVARSSDERTRLRYELQRANARFERAAREFTARFGLPKAYLTQRCPWPAQECIQAHWTLNPLDEGERRQLIKLACEQ